MKKDKEKYISIDIPTKPYCMAYIYHKLGKSPKIEQSNCDSISTKLYDVLKVPTNERRSQFKREFYTKNIRIQIPVAVFRRFGANLNETNIKSFNLYIEMEIKFHFYQIMDNLIESLPSFTNNLPEVRRKLGIDTVSWSDDSMKKCYYRKRKRKGEKLLYDKTIYAGVPYSFS